MEHRPFEELLPEQLVKNFLVTYRIWRVISILTTFHHWTLFLAGWSHLYFLFLEDTF
jgi:hypothetical protein